VSYEYTANDDTRQVDAAEDLVWSTYNDWPPDGHRVSFRDGNPHNLAIDNLELLTPQQAAALDIQNERTATAAIVRAGHKVRVFRDGTYFVVPADGGRVGYKCSGIGGLIAIAQVVWELNGGGGTTTQRQFATNSIGATHAARQ